MLRLALRVILPVLASGSFLVSGAAVAQQAAAPGDRCTGGLCDLYYSMQGAPAAQPKQGGQATAPRSGLLGTLFAPEAPTQPGVPAAQQPRAAGDSQSAVAGAGGGLVGMLSGAPSEGCTGILCSLTGEDAPRAPAPPEGAAAPPAAATTAEQPAVETASDDQAAEPLIRHRPEPRCVATAHDPWACAR